MQYLVKIFCLHLISIKKKTERKVDMWIPLRMQVGNVGGGQSCSIICTTLGYRWWYSKGHQCVNFWGMITRETVIFDSFPFYINILEESTYIIDSSGRNLSLNLTHHFVGQILSFTRPFVFHIVLPVKRQLLITSHPCLRLTCAHLAEVCITSHTVCTQKGGRLIT